jgi:addiction module HigA family antidote
MLFATDEEIATVENEFAPVTPGEMLKNEFLAEIRAFTTSARQGSWNFAKPDYGDGKQPSAHYTADTALRFGLYFGNRPEFWLNLQTRYDLKLARRKLKPQIAKRIKAQRAA